MIGKIKAVGIERKLNWRPGLPTRIAHFEHDKSIVFPPFLSLMAKMPPITDQGQEGACTGHSAVAPLFVAHAGRTPSIMPAPAFIYYNERLMNGQQNQDSGAAISDIYRAANHYGVCDEAICPYVAGDYAMPPSQAAYAAAAGLRAHIYAPVLQTEAGVKGCLNHGFPVDFGFTVYDSFESLQVAQTGIVPMPGPGENVLGGHAVDIIGYNDGPGTNLGIPERHFMVRNSWGTGWGASGYCYMPYEYLLDNQLASDFWMIRLL